MLGQDKRIEVFKEIPEMPGYFASNNGRIRKGNTKIISTHENIRGYIIAQIMMDGIRFAIGVHRLVAMAFLGDVEGMEVDHLDFDKNNNCVENLEIVTRAENMRRFHGSIHSKSTYKNISISQRARWAKTVRLPKARKARPIKYKDGERPKTGGRQKGTAGIRIFLTVPPTLAESLPKNPKEWRAVVITTLAETYTLKSLEELKP